MVTNTAVAGQRRQKKSSEKTPTAKQHTKKKKKCWRKCFLCDPCQFRKINERRQKFQINHDNGKAGERVEMNRLWKQMGTFDDALNV
jgi:hypothetical protein